MLGVPASPWGTQELGHPQRLMDCLLIEAVILLVGSMSFECSLMVLLAAFQAFSRAPTQSSLLSAPGGARDTWASFAKSCTDGTSRHLPTCSHFPPRVTHVLKRSHLAVSWATSGKGMTQVKSNSPFYPLQCIQSQVFLSQ